MELFKQLNGIIFYYAFRKRKNNNLFEIMLLSRFNDVNVVFIGACRIFNIFYILLDFNEMKYLELLIKRIDFIPQLFIDPVTEIYFHNNAVYNLISTDNINMFKYLCENDKTMIYIFKKHNDKCCISYIAAYHKSYKILEYLIDNKFDKINTQACVEINGHFNTLIKLMSNNKIDLVKKILNKIKKIEKLSNRIDINYIDYIIVTCGNMSNNDKIDLINLLLDKQINVNCINSLNANALSYISHVKNIELFNRTLELTDNLNMISTEYPYYTFPAKNLIFDIDDFSFEALKKMIARSDFNIHYKNFVTKQSYLTMGLLKRNYRFVKHLLSECFYYDVNFGFVDSNRNAITFVCEDTNDVELLNMILKHLPTIYNTKLLHTLCYKQKCEMLEAILKYRFIDIDGKNDKNETPLEIAVKLNNYEMASELLWKGADASHNSMMLYATKNNNFKMLKLLLSYNATLNFNDVNKYYGITEPISAKNVDLHTLIFYKYCNNPIHELNGILKTQIKILCDEDDYKKMEVLVNKGVNVKNSIEFADIAIKNRSLKMLKLVCRYGFTNYENTLKNACKTGNEEIVKLILKYCPEQGLGQYKTKFTDFATSYRMRHMLTGYYYESSYESS